MRRDVMKFVSSAGGVAGRRVRGAVVAVVFAPPRVRASRFVTQRIARVALRRAATPMVQLTDDSRNARNSRHVREHALKTRSRTMRETRQTRVETFGGVTA